MLRGRCFFCHERIPFRYVLVEVLTSLSAIATYLRFGMTPTGGVIFALIVALIILTFIDIDWFILPDVITLPGTAIALGVAIINQFFEIFSEPIVASLWDSFYGLLFGAGALWMVAQLYLWIRKIDGLGLGDVKLLMMTGILMGPEVSIYSIFVGSVVGAVGGILTLLIQRKSIRQHYIPFGPYLAIATVMYIFSGMWVIEKFVEAMGSVIQSALPL